MPPRARRRQHIPSHPNSGYSKPIGAGVFGLCRRGLQVSISGGGEGGRQVWVASGFWSLPAMRHERRSSTPMPVIHPFGTPRPSCGIQVILLMRRGRASTSTPTHAVGEHIEKLHLVSASSGFIEPPTEGRARTSGAPLRHRRVKHTQRVARRAYLETSTSSPVPPRGGWTADRMRRESGSPDNPLSLSREDDRAEDRIVWPALGLPPCHQDLPLVDRVGSSNQSHGPEDLKFICAGAVVIRRRTKWCGVNGNTPLSASTVSLRVGDKRRSQCGNTMRSRRGTL
jgi:hypothetical protein